MKNLCSAFLLTLFVMLLPIIPAAAQEESPETIAMHPEELMMVGAGTIKEILKADMLLLDNDKRYRLDNLRVPPYEEGPAVSELNKMFLNKKVKIYTYHDNDSSVDRYGVSLVHIVSDDGVWIQEHLISEGLAWVYSSETSRELVAPLTRAEEKARSQRLGFWANPGYKIRTPENVKDHINSFQIVEGEILSVGSGQVTYFLNFGDKWKDDFTVALLKPAWSLFSTEDQKRFNPREWEGRTIRIRGWVEKKNGPMIVLTHPEQIEFIPESPKKSPPPAPRQ